MIKISADLASGTQVARLPELIVTIGRSRDNLVVLNDPAVSAVHARVSWTGSAYRIEDLGSANGLWVGGKAVSEAWIASSPTPMTCFLGRVRCVIEVCDPCFACNDESRFLMAAPAITVGRARDNNWVLAYPSISSHHLRLTRDGEQMFVHNLSEQGTRVGGLLVDQAPIAVGDVIQLGDATILYASPPLLDDGFTFEAERGQVAGAGQRFRVAGSLGREQADELAGLLEAAGRRGIKAIDLDMSACRKLHPLCLDVLLEAARSLAAANGRLRLVAPSQAVARAVALANAGQRLILAD
ncbi:MAG: FHA domain-containing protein [Betaproteobacteria bacterium]|nr:FHA domain-containing protein [Betaproteobacteria bacterium]